MTSLRSWWWLCAVSACLVGQSPGLGAEPWAAWPFGRTFPNGFCSSEDGAERAAPSLPQSPHSGQGCTSDSPGPWAPRPGWGGSREEDGFPICLCSFGIKLCGPSNVFRNPILTEALTRGSGLPESSLAKGLGLGAALEVPDSSHRVRTVTPPLTRNERPCICEAQRWWLWARVPPASPCHPGQGKHPAL